MRELLLKDFPIARLEYGFRPPGLPLIAKTASRAPTTSILVRGGAGAGKTTLAVALAHTIARETKGTALHLATEFVPTEVLYKARMLGLPDDTVVVGGTPGPHEPGVIETEHLLRTLAAGHDEISTSMERKRAAIEAVWELMERADRGEGRENLRVVVIDAFGLPDAESEEKELRQNVLSLVQILESRGISVVLVEEQGASAEHWLPFVVDIVLEVSLEPDPDTGELVRKLRCPKSRYATSLPGPHDYGVDVEGRPSVWPDPLEVPMEHVLRGGKAVEQPGFFAPFDADRYLASRDGLVLLSDINSRRVWEALFSTAGIEACHVQCGPLTIIEVPGASEVVELTTGAGPFAIAWTLLERITAGQAQAVVFQGIEFLLARRRFHAGMLHVLAVLRKAGAIVLAYGNHDELKPIVPLANYADVPGGTQADSLTRHFRLRRAIRWLPFMMKPPEPDDAVTFWESLLGISLGQYSGPEEEVVGTQYLDLHTIAYRQTPVTIPDYSKLLALAKKKGNSRSEFDGLMFFGALLLHFIGEVSSLEALFAELRKSIGPATYARSALLTAGEMDAALRILSLGVTEPEEFASLLSYWHGLCASYAGNRDALDQVATTLEEDGNDLLLRGLYLRALAAHERFADLDREIAALAAQHNLPDWFTERLRAESWLGPVDAAGDDADEALDRAIDALGALLAGHGEAMPPIHRAEVFYNQGLMLQRRNRDQEANAAFRQALEANPHLEPARARLKA